MRIDWSTITPAQAKRLLAPAARAERIAAGRYNATGSPDDETAMLEAFTLWENLRVFILCGERPS